MEIVPVTEGKLSFGTAPAEPDDVDQLVRQGFTVVIDIDGKNSSREREWCSERSLKYVDWLRIPDDYTPIAPGKLREVVNLVRMMESGSKVYLHCWAALGRSPTCAAAYLIASGKSVEQAKDLIVSKRPGVWQGKDAKYASLLGEFAKSQKLSR